MRSYGSKCNFDMYQVHLRNAIKVIDFSPMILEVCVCVYECMFRMDFGHVSTNKENTENKSDKRTKKRERFFMNRTYINILI